MTMKTLNKMFSISLSLALVGSGTPMPAQASPAASAPVFAERLAPKASLGYVASSYAPGNEEKPRLVVIADLHAHLDVQRNIMGIMEGLLPKIRGNSAQKVPVFLEGGWKPNLEEPLRTMSNPGARKFMNEYFLLKAELGGPQAFSERIAGTNQITMIGVEDKDEYLANKAVFAKSYPARKQILEAIKLQEVALSALEKHVEPRSYKSLKNMRTAYLAGRVSAERLAKTLIRHADRMHMDNANVATLKDVSAADAETVESAMSAVYKEVSENLSSKRPLLSYFRRSLENEPTVRKNVSLVNADLDLLKRLLANQLGPNEVALAYSHIPQLERAASVLLADQPVSVDVSRVIRESLEFYPLAFLRDESLAKNALASLAGFGSDATGVLVAGGFHTDAISSYLQRQHVPHLVIHPVVSRDMTTDEQLNYVKRLCNEHITQKELEQDMALVKNHKKLARATSSSPASFTGLAKPAVDSTDKEGEGLYNGMASDVRETIMDLVKANDAKALQHYLDQMQLGLQAVSEAVDAIELVTRNGRYVVAGQDASVKNSFVEALNIARQIAPSAGWSDTMTISGQKDMDRVLSTDKMSEMKDRKEMIFPASFVRKIQAVDAGEKPAPGTQDEVAYIAAKQALFHEVFHGAGLSENAVIGLGATAGAAAIAEDLGQQAVPTYAKVLKSQMSAGKATQAVARQEGFGDKIANFFTSKDLKAEPVVSMAKRMGADFPELSPAQIEAEYAALNDSLTVRAARLAGNNTLLATRLRERLAQISRTARAFSTQA